MKPLALFLLLSVCGAASAIPQDEIARADARVHEIGDVESYVEEVGRALDMARRGDYGRIERDDLVRAEDAQQEIERLLAGREKASDLDTEDRVKLLNSQELITSILRSDEKNRKVCKLVATTGTRVGKSECMTVAQRERRALQASRDMREIQRLNCRPGAPLSASEGAEAPC